MANRTQWLRFPVQLAVTAMIVLGLVGVAHMASSRDRAEAFDQAAAQTRFQFEGSGRGVGVAAHVLEGRWRVEYDDPRFTGSLVYDLREEEDGLRGYLVESVDESGQSVSDNSLIFELHSWAGTKGEGSCSMESDGVRYEAQCDIALQSADELRVRYSYRGYDGEETWTRVEEGNQ